MSPSFEQIIGRTLRERAHKSSSFPLDGAASPGPDPVSDFYKTPLGMPYEEPKTCLGCGAKFTTIPEGGLPCGH